MNDPGRRLSPLWIAGLLASAGAAAAQEPYFYPPAQPTLEVVDPSDSTALRLRWVNGGVQDGQHQAIESFDSLDIRYSTDSPITGVEAWFAAATPAQGIPAPGEWQSHGQMVLAPLQPGQLTFVGIRGRYGDYVSDLVVTLGTPPEDPGPPDAVELAVIALAEDSAEISWVAPGDDGSTGHAQHYDVRYSTGAPGPDVAAWFAAAAHADGPPFPDVAGTIQHMTLGTLDPDTRYSVAMRASDEVGWGPAGSVLTFSTLPPEPKSPKASCLGASGTGPAPGLVIAGAALLLGSARRR